jgi:hypothetical protein
MAWYAGARRILTKPAELADYLEALEKEIPDPWVTFMRGQSLSEDLSTASRRAWSSSGQCSQPAM